MLTLKRFFCVMLLLVPLLPISCRQKQKALFELMENTGIDFSNDIHNKKDFNIFTYRNFYNGGGVAIGDINNDGLPDIFFTANMAGNKLYLNKGNLKFEDISDSAGFTEKEKWSTGVVMADVNHDGWLDIYVCNAGYENGKVPENKLFINNHDLTFTESAKQYGLTNTGGYCTHAAFFDYDMDGDLDCFIINNSFIPVNTLNYANMRNLRAPDWPVADFLKGGGDRLLRNDNGKFIDVSKEAGIYGSLISFGLGVTVGDVNGDHYPDIYVSNDFFERDYLYINQKNGTFRDELEQYVQHTSLASMGADMADINNDGYPDIFTTDMLPDDDYRLKTTSSFDGIDVYRLKEKQGFYHQFMQNTLQLNNRNGKFMDIAHYAGVAASDWSWGALVFDADNDGLSDIYICNGINHDVTDQDFIDFFANDVIQKMVMTGKKEQIEDIISKMPSHPLVNKVFRNKGDLTFSDEGKAWGITQPSFSNGAAYADLDNDGDLDLVVNNVNQRAFIYRNNSRETNGNNYIGVSLKGVGGNTYAVGSVVKVYQGNQVFTRELIPSRGFQSSIDYKIIIGLGKGQADSMVVVWPNRSSTKYDHPAINRVHLIQQPEQAMPVSEPAISLSPYLRPVQHNFEKHREDDFVDFYSERNIPMMISREGPHATLGDVNGDGLEDIYIAGAAGQPGQLYIQTATGFTKKSEPAFVKQQNAEDVAVLFFDCDQDGDLDLFVGAGGNNHPPNSPQMQHRLYKNDGKGNFSLAPDAFPKNDANISVAIANDFDHDGDLDLFVGGRSVPFNYGVSPSSYIYVNDGKGKFTDIAATNNKEIASVGLVTGAVWADVTGDSQKELVIVGEWMTPRIFTYNGRRFTEIKTNLDSMYGWWQSVAAADLDGDGDQDLILGNIGENFYLKPSKEAPVKMWMSDFDNNGITEKILTRTIGNRDMPVFLKRDMTDQLTSLKKQNLKHEDFAGKSIRELFTFDQMKNTSVKQFNYASSCIAINEGNGRFTVKRLPPMVQFSSLNAIHCTDINNDGRIDLVLGGNKFGFLPQFCRLDASFGHVLINKGNNVFDYLGPERSGLSLPDEIRDIQEFGNKKGRYLLFLQNDQFPALYQIKSVRDSAHEN